MEVIVIGFDTLQSASENFCCTWKHRQHAWKHQQKSLQHLGVPATSLEVPGISLEVSATSLVAPGITVEQSGKNDIFFATTSGVPGNYCYYLSFNDY